MKTLVIITHPDIENSVLNKRWLEELSKYPEKYEIHQLHKAYPDGKIDVAAEQKRIEKYNKIIFQFPIYWFSSPSLLKKWIDEVIVYGWAFGSKSEFKIAHKKVALALTVGLNEYEYTSLEKYKYTLKQLTRPFELTFEYVKADYQPFFAYYGIESSTSNECIEKSVPLYLEFLEAF